MSAPSRSATLASRLARFQSSVAAAPATAVAVSSPAPSAVAALPIETLSHIATTRRRNGQIITQQWNRYNIAKSPRPFDLTIARSVAPLSDTIDKTENKKVIIFKWSRSAMTSGLAATREWGLRFEKRHAWANPLMGWLSGQDASAQVQINARFESAEQAILFAERNGLKYEVQRDYSRVPGRVDAAYAYNFVPPAVQAKLEKLGPRKARHIFTHPGGKTDQFVNYRRTQWEHHPWKPYGEQTEAAWTGPAWPESKATPEEHGGH